MANTGFDAGSQVARFPTSSNTKAIVLAGENMKKDDPRWAAARKEAFRGAKGVLKAPAKLACTGYGLIKALAAVRCF
jgi:hypothetical protein